MIYSNDAEILTTALNWLEDNHQVTLITVLQTWGSSPRPVGSLMIIRDDGLHAGSVSGGCVEEDLLVRAKNNQLSNEIATTLSFGSSNQEAVHLGLPCGGRLELLIEPLDNLVQIKTIIDKMSHDELITRRVCLNTGEISLHPAPSNITFDYHDNTIKKVFGPSWHILLIGAGHLSQYVTRMALMLDYKVSVCDPRDEYQNSWPIENIEVLNTMPDDCVKQLANHQRSIILALTHDPKLDDMALLEALTLNCFYVGALGSKRNNDKRRKRLAELGLTSKQLAQLHGPVGLPIGSHTPAEIALSILADITATRNNINLSQTSSTQTITAA